MPTEVTVNLRSENWNELNPAEIILLCEQIVSKVTYFLILKVDGQNKDQINRLYKHSENIIETIKEIAFLVYRSRAFLRVISPTEFKITSISLHTMSALNWVNLVGGININPHYQEPQETDLTFRLLEQIPLIKVIQLLTTTVRASTAKLVKNIVQLQTKYDEICFSVYKIATELSTMEIIMSLIFNEYNSCQKYDGQAIHVECTIYKPGEAVLPVSILDRTKFSRG